MKSQTPIDLRLTRRAASGIHIIDSDQPKRNFISQDEVPIKKTKTISLPPTTTNTTTTTTTVARKSSRINKQLKQTILGFKKEDTTSLKRKTEAVVAKNDITKKQKTIHQMMETKANEQTSAELVAEPASEPVTEPVSENKEQTKLPQHIEQEIDLSLSQDTPSPPSSCYLEPTTPPMHELIAPYKTYLSPADKKRIEHEKSVLVKLRKALDIVITDRAARHRPAFYHQIEPVLRNSTGRSITIGHVSQIMYVAPRLYTLEVKELRDYGGKVTEAFLLGFGQDWAIPLTGKNLEKRATMLMEAIDHFFHTHPEPDASIPEAPLPRLNLIVDKKEWIKDAKLPPGVRALLETHEKVKEAEAEKVKPKPIPTGTVKERMAALKARLAAKKAAQNNP